MILTSLDLLNYRNYSNLSLNPDSKINIIYGFNAQGKTNLLESIYYLATTHSHRNKRDLELLKWTTNYLNIKGTVLQDGHEANLEVNFQQNGQKILKVNGIKKSRLPEYLGNLSVVLFSPEDLNIIKGSPKDRRRFLDFEIAQVSKSYAYNLLQYAKILNERNFLLKNIKSDRRYLDQLEVWDNQLVQIGSNILAKRFEIVKMLAFFSKNNHFKITAGQEYLELKYLCSFEARPDFLITEIKKSFSKKLLEVKNDEIKRGITLVGPHRDDLNFYLNGSDAKLYGSQGQQRTIALSLKLAELEVINQVLGEYPVLLLDDVLSELDNLRRHYLITSVMTKIQTFITTTNLEFIDNTLLAEAKILRIDSGKLITEYQKGV